MQQIPEHRSRGNGCNELAQKWALRSGLLSQQGPQNGRTSKTRPLPPPAELAAVASCRILQGLRLKTGATCLR